MKSAALKSEPRTELYETDFFAWTQEQSALLKAGRFSQADIANIIEEIETLGRSDKHEIANRLEVLLTHLLKWRFQPELRSRSWAGTMNEQRKRIRRVLRESPSLRALPGEIFLEEYQDARKQAAIETGLPLSMFPERPDFTVDNALDDGFEVQE